MNGYMAGLRLLIAALVIITLAQAAQAQSAEGLVGGSTIFEDDFNSYTDGDLAGQGGWVNVIRGTDFDIQGTTVMEGTKAVHAKCVSGSYCQIRKTGSDVSAGKETFYVYPIAGNSDNEWNIFSADGTYLFYIEWGRTNFILYGFTIETIGTQNNNQWNLVEFEWLSNDTVRARVNNGSWTSYISFMNAGDPGSILIEAEPANAEFYFDSIAENPIGQGEYSKKITIDHTKIDSDLTDFPVLVKLDSSNFDFSKARSDGYDIKFTSSYGTLLKYERERHDAANQKAEYWVKIPSVLSTIDTDFYIYYGNSSASDGADPTNVWDSNFKGVWHLKEDPSGTTPQIKDSTSNNNHLSSYGIMGSGQSVEGKIGKALNFDGSNDYLGLPAGAILNPNGEFEVEMWIYADVVREQGLMAVGPTWGSRVGSDEYFSRDHTTYYGLEGEIFNDNLPEGSVQHSSGTWYYVSWSRHNAGNSFRFWTDNAADGNFGTTNDLGTGTLYLAFAQFLDGASSTPWDGKMDEIRFSSIRRSDAWRKASYFSGNNNLLTFSEEEITTLSIKKEVSAPTSIVTPRQTTIASRTPYVQPTPAPKQESTNWGLLGGILVLLAIGIVVLSLRRRERAPRPAPVQTNKAGTNILDAGFALSKEASSLFNKKDYTGSLKTYSKALDKFLIALKQAKGDASLAKTIENNILSTRKNILACKSALGTSISESAKRAFEEERCEDAEQLYNTAVKHFEEALKDAEELEDTDEINKVQGLISKTKSNINSCYIATDKKKVEELSRRASILFKEATTNREKRELFKAREALKKASDTIDEAFTLATNRSFSDAQRTLGDLLRNIRNEMNAIDSEISGGVEQVKTRGEVSDITTDQPDIVHKTPFPQYLPKADKLLVLREYEFFNGFIRVKLSVNNKNEHTITDVALDLDIDDHILRLDHHEPDYVIRKGKIRLENISPNSDKTISMYLEPLTCSKEGMDINCRVDYKNAYGKPDSVRMEVLKIPVVCPIFHTEQDINIGRLKELIASLPAHGSKVFSMYRGIAIEGVLALCREIIQMHDVRHVRTFKTADGKTFETWYYGKTKIKKIDLVIKASVSKETESIELFVAAPDQEALTGLLAELVRNLTKKGEALGKLAPQINLIIKDSIIQRSNLLDSCDFSGICGANVVIEDSIVQRSNFGESEDENKE